MTYLIVSNAAPKGARRRLGTRYRSGTAAVLATALALGLGLGCSSTVGKDAAESHESPIGAAEAARAAEFATGDIIWRNIATGENAYWSMRGSDIGSTGSFTPVKGNDWKLAGSADFNGDGKADLLWRNYVTGENAVWYLDGADKIASSAFITPIADANWQLAGTADMDRDGHPDLLWRNASSGQNAIWYMNNTSLLRGVFFQSIPDANWKLRGGGDLDGDGRPELLWRNSATGQNAAWFMDGDGSALSRGEFLIPIADANWQMETVGDLDGDGKADIVWKNLGSGETAVWYMNGSAIDGSAFLTPVPDPSWRAVGTRRHVNHGFQFDARSGSAAYDIGIRSWLLVPAAKPADKTTFLASDGRRVISAAQMVLPKIDDGRSPQQVEAESQAAFIEKLNVRTWQNTRGVLSAPTFDAQRALFGALRDDMPATLDRLRTDGGPSRDSWGTCQAESIAVTRAAYFLAFEVITCAASVAALGGCVGSGFVWFPIGCVAIAKIAIVSCGGLPFTACALNNYSAELKCCQGETVTDWPIPFSSCSAPRESAKHCTCAEKHAGTHLEVGPPIVEGGLFPSYQCSSSGPACYVTQKTVKGSALYAWGKTSIPNEATKSCSGSRSSEPAGTVYPPEIHQVANARAETLSVTLGNSSDCYADRIYSDIKNFCNPHRPANAIDYSWGGGIFGWQGAYSAGTMSWRSYDNQPVYGGAPYGIEQEATYDDNATCPLTDYYYETKVLYTGRMVGISCFPIQ